MRASRPLSIFIFTGTFATVAACGGGGSHGNGSGAGGTGGATTGSSSGGSSGSGTTITSSSSSSTSNPVTRFPFPQVTYGGGPLVTAPKIVSVTFPGDPMASQLAAFGSSLTSSSYWSTVTSGLCGTGSTCIGSGTGSSAAIAASPGTSYVDYTGGTAPSGQPANTLQPYLESLISALPAAQQPDASTAYVFYFPASTTITVDSVTSCTDFGGYHSAMTMGGTNVVYAIVPECPPLDAGPALSVLEGTTFGASHEILEAVTDPSIPSMPNGYLTDETHQSSAPWSDIGDAELGDLCVDVLGYGQDETTESGFTVQRIWSIANAAAGNVDPCVPIPSGDVYFNAFPTVSAVIVDVGQSKTFEVDALATGAMAPWTVSVEDLGVFNGATPYLSFSIAGGTNQNDVVRIAVKSGDRLEVTVKMLVDPSTIPDSPPWGLALVTSLNGADPQAATAGHYWPFIVLTTAQAKANGITMMERIPRHVLSRMRGLAHAGAHAGRARFLDRLLGPTPR